MSIPDFDVALEVSKLKSTPAIFAIPAIRQGENSKNSKNSSPHLRIVPTADPKNSKNSKNSSPSIPLGPDLKETGLEWIVWPADKADPDFDAKWASVDLRDLGKLYGVRVVHAGERILAIFQPDLPAELVAYASELLAEARPYLTANLGKLPILTQPEAVEIILDMMRQHKGLRFCRGDGGSRWPLYPKGWTAGQRATVQSLWLAAGDAPDLDDFMGLDTG